MIRHINSHEELREYLLLWKQFSKPNTKCVIFGTPREMAIDTLLAKLDASENERQSLAMFVYNVAVDIFGVNLAVANQLSPLLKTPTIGIIVLSSEAGHQADEVLFMLRTSGAIPSDSAGLTLLVPSQDIPPYEMPIDEIDGSPMLPIHLLLIEQG